MKLSIDDAVGLLLALVRANVEIPDITKNSCVTLNVSKKLDLMLVSDAALTDFAEAVTPWITPASVPFDPAMVSTWSLTSLTSCSEKERCEFLISTVFEGLLIRLIGEGEHTHVTVKALCDYFVS